jgi:hypothetical protein
MNKETYTFVAKHYTCQQHKGEAMKPLKALQPLSILAIVWIDISMDFTVRFPKSGNKLVIMVVVDHHPKYAQFCALQHPFKASTITQVFMDNVFKLCGMPNCCD